MATIKIGKIIDCHTGVDFGFGTGEGVELTIGSVQRVKEVIVFRSMPRDLVESFGQAAKSGMPDQALEQKYAEPLSKHGFDLSKALSSGASAIKIYEGLRSALETFLKSAG